MTTVAICVTTLRRPAALARLLDSLARLRFEKRPGAKLVTIIVDNDAARSARPVADAWRGRLGWPLAYAVEPHTGISHGRNRCVALALDAGADFVAFIDDDERASPGWLDELLDVQARYGADVVEGPVLPCYDARVPDWVRRGGFFEERRHATGAPLECAKSGNVLVARRLLAGPAPPFDAGLALSGGEDTLFFRRARAAGAAMVWADDAIVEETVPPARACARWILRRSFRGGNAYVWCERALRPPLHHWLLRAARASGRIAQGALLLGAAPLRGRAGAVRALCHVFQGCGSLAGIAGVRFEAYRVTDGS